MSDSNSKLPDYSALDLKNTLVSLDGGVAVVTINRPKEYAGRELLITPGRDVLRVVICDCFRRNTFGGSFPAEVISVFDLLDRDDRVRVIVFTADPKAPAYCSGVSSARLPNLSTDSSLPNAIPIHY